MTRIAVAAATVALVFLPALVLLPGLAFAHGGSYQPPAPRGPRGGGSGGGGPQIPPGTADAPAPLTRWESWWAANKSTYLRLGERMREAPGHAGPTTPRDGNEAGAGVDGADVNGDGADGHGSDARQARDADLRKSLVPVFIEALGDPHYDVRTAAAIALGKSGDPQGSKPLKEAAVKDDRKEVRNSAVLALGLLGLEGDVPFLDEILNRRTAEMRHRAFAAFSLGLIGGDGAMASLQRFIDPKAGPKYAGGSRLTKPLLASVYIALGLTDDPGAKETLYRGLTKKSQEDEVRAFILLALGRLKDRDSLGRIMRMLRTEDKPTVRRSCAISLGKIATAADTEAVDALFLAMAKDRDPTTSHFAAVALGQMADDAVRERLRKIWEKAKSRDRPFIGLSMALAHDELAAPLLRKQLVKATDYSERSSYCISLALLDDRTAIPILESELDNKGRRWLQSYAAIGLGMLRSRDSAPKLRALLAKTNQADLKMNVAVALGLMHDATAHTFLVETLRGDGTIYERSSAAMALGVLRLNRAAPDLLAVFRDHKGEQEQVRAYAMVSLGILADPSPVPKLSRFSIDNNYGVTVDPLSEVLSIL